MMFCATDVSDVLVAWGPVLAPVFAAIAAVISAMYAKGAHTLAKHTDREVNNKNEGEPTLRQMVIDVHECQSEIVKVSKEHGAILQAIQHALHENNARVRHILSSLATFEANEKGEYIWVSRRWAEITGVALWDAHGRNWEKTIYPADKERVADEWFRAIELQESFGPTSYRITPRNGEPLWVVAEASPVRNSSGDLVGYIGSVDMLEDNTI
jgi:PAS domain S-box-containing protein